jgi:Protein of unknown function (DUF3192)
MRYFSLSSLVLIGVLILPGCATLSQENTETFRKANQDHLKRLQIGMTKDVVFGTMGTHAVSRCVHAAGGICLEFETIDNPHRRSDLMVDGKRYEVLYYYTDDEERDLRYYYQELKRHDNELRDDQLTPVLLENGKLVGWGQNIVDTKLKAARAVAE